MIFFLSQREWPGVGSQRSAFAAYRACMIPKAHHYQHHCAQTESRGGGRGRGETQRLEVGQVSMAAYVYVRALTLVWIRHAIVCVYVFNGVYIKKRGTETLLSLNYAHPHSSFFHWKCFHFNFLFTLFWKTSLSYAPDLSSIFSLVHEPPPPGFQGSLSCFVLLDYIGQTIDLAQIVDGVGCITGSSGQRGEMRNNLSH